MSEQKKTLDQDGLSTLWANIKNKFITKDSAEEVIEDLLEDSGCIYSEASDNTQIDGDEPSSLYVLKGTEVQTSGEVTSIDATYDASEQAITENND